MVQRLNKRGEPGRRVGHAHGARSGAAGGASPVTSKGWGSRVKAPLGGGEPVGQVCGGGRSPKEWCNVEAVKTGFTMAFDGGGSATVAIGEAERYLQLRGIERSERDSSI
jgi:hypothetical protein